MHKCVICGKLYGGGREIAAQSLAIDELVKRLITRFGEVKKVVDHDHGHRL